MARFRVHADIEAADEKTAISDVHAMSAAHTNKSVQVKWVERREGA